MQTAVERSSRVSLAERVRDQIVQHPESHNQKVWVQQTSCGTTACVAGWAVLLSGATVVLVNDLLSSGRVDREVQGFHECLPADGDRHAPVPIYLLAERLLGITSAQSDYLFDSHRTRPELLRALDNLIRRDEIRHDDFSAPLTRTEERAPLATVI